MKRRAISLGAVALLVVGFVAGYVVNVAAGQKPAAAATAKTSTAATTTNLASTVSIDTAIEQAYATASKSVVFVKNPGSGTGSGVIYDSTGDIVTNAHVTAGGKTFKVTFSSGKTATATLVGTDTADDLAVIHVNLAGLTAATFAGASGYQVAETVLAIGSPLGLQQSVSSGLISGVNRTEQEPNGAYIPNAIQTSAPINPGNSGGGLVSLNGVVVGIPTMVQTSTTGGEAVQNVGFAIPSDRVTYIAGQIIQYGKVMHTGRAFLGVAIGDASAQQSTPYGYFGGGGQSVSVSGAVINSVRASGPAGRAGIQQGDVITKFNGTTITSSDDLLAALARQKPGTTVTVVFNRNGTNHTVQVTLAELQG